VNATAGAAVSGQAVKSSIEKLGEFAQIADSPNFLPVFLLYRRALAAALAD